MCRRAISCKVRAHRGSLSSKTFIHRLQVHVRNILSAHLTGENGKSLPWLCEQQNIYRQFPGAGIRRPLYTCKMRWLSTSTGGRQKLNNTVSGVHHSSTLSENMCETSYFCVWQILMVRTHRGPLSSQNLFDSLLVHTHDHFVCAWIRGERRLSQELTIAFSEAKLSATDFKCVCPCDLTEPALLSAEGPRPNGEGCNRSPYASCTCKKDV